MRRVALAPRRARADDLADARLVALAPTDDAGRVIALGPVGQIYVPDAKGWARTLPSTIAAQIDTVGRGDVAGVVVGAGGAVYRLESNGWTAIRLAQKGRAIAGTGRGVAALGRDVFDLDKGAADRTLKIGQAPGAVLALAAGAGGVVVRTDRGVFRMPGGKPVANVPDSARLLDDRWAIADRGAFDLRSGKLIPWPVGLTIQVAAPTGDGKLAAIGKNREGIVLLVVDKKLAQESVVAAATSPAVGIVVDRQHRVAIAFRDGHIALRDRGTWSTSVVRDELPPDHPGSPPATTP
ncbi:MAG: hypothetical protein NT062_15210 [Proteobacteria bacterium]|nr:hypothetical protein [Pseudomonadota bacterium]